MNPNRPHKNRRSIRLNGYDYSSPGEYFITICTHSRQCLFGNVADREMALNDADKMVDTWWNKITEKFPNALLDVYQIMPNHFHAIVGITDPNTVGADPRVCPTVLTAITRADTRVRPNRKQVRPNRWQVHPNRGRSAPTWIVL